MTPEKTFSTLVGRNLNGHRQRIETTSGTGIPDLNMCCGGVELWVETKVVHGRKVDIRNTQVAWHLERTKFGGRTFFMIRWDELIVVAPGYEAPWLWRIRDNFPNVYLELSKVSMWRRPWNWASIQAQLFEAQFPWV